MGNDKIKESTVNQQEREFQPAIARPGEPKEEDSVERNKKGQIQEWIYPLYYWFPSRSIGEIAFDDSAF